MSTPEEPDFDLNPEDPAPEKPKKKTEPEPERVMAISTYLMEKSEIPEILRRALNDKHSSKLKTPSEWAVIVKETQEKRVH